MKILLDTNFCVQLLKNSWHLEELAGNELITTDFIEKEIKKVNKKNKTIFTILNKNNVKTLKTGLEPEDNDEELLKTAEKINAAIATNDSELRRKAEKKGIKTIYLRQRKILKKS